MARQQRTGHHEREGSNGAEFGLIGKIMPWAPGLGFLFVCTIRIVRIYFDPAKNERNIRDRDLSFEAAAKFGFDTALVYVDDRQAYGEVRYIALGLLGERLHVLCFTEAADGIRVISFRRANSREVNRYAKVQASH